MTDKASRSVEVAVKAVAASMVAGATATILYVVDAPAEFVAPAAGWVAVGAGLSWVVGRRGKLPKAYIKLRAISTVVAAGWVWWASCSADGPWQEGFGFSFMVGTMAYAFAASMMAAPIEKPISVIEEKRKALTKDPAWIWWNRIQTICNVKLQVVDVYPHSNSKGHEVHCRFRAGGDTIEKITPKLKNLASDANLPQFGGIDIRDGDTKRDFILTVTEEDALGKESLRFPLSSIGPRSIYDNNRDFGHYGNMDPILLPNMRQNSVVVAGQNGAGKSGFLHNMIAHHSMCVDELVWVIDLNSKGKLAIPWLYSWEKRGFKGKPPIDAVAGTVEEARALIDFASQIAQSRAQDYRDEIAAAGDGDVPLSERIPGIRIIVDEPKMIFNGKSGKHHDLEMALTELQETGRSVGIRPDYGVLGATSRSIPMAIKDQIVHRAVMAVAEKSEVGYFMSWAAARAVDLNRLQSAPGTVYLSEKGSDLARIGRFYHIKSGEGESLEAIADFASTVRPEIDEAAKRLPGYAAYAERWDRYKAALNGAPAAQMAAQPPQAAASPAPSTGTGSLREQLKRANQEIQAPVQEEKPVDEFDALVASLEVDHESILESTGGDQTLLAIREFLIAQDGYASLQDLLPYLRAKLGDDVKRTTIMTRLAKYVEKGWIQNPGRGTYSIPQ